MPKITATSYFAENPLFELKDLLSGSMEASYMAPGNNYLIECKNCETEFSRRGDSTAFKALSKCPGCRFQYSVAEAKIIDVPAKRNAKDDAKAKAGKKPVEELVTDDEEEDPVPAPAATVNPFDMLRNANATTATKLGIRATTKKLKQAPAAPAPVEVPTPVETPKKVNGKPKAKDCLDTLLEKQQDHPVEHGTFKIIRLKQGEIYKVGDILIIAE
jgi:hypothetical protein